MAESDCRLAALIAERDRRNPADPLDPEAMRIRQPHFIAASLPQVHEALERRRDYARRTVEGASDLGCEAH